MDKAAFAISKAKAQLIIQHPFYASLLCNLPFIERSNIATMAVDGVNAYYNPDFVTSLENNEVKFVLAHEVMHCVFDHMGRLGTRSHRRWNMAADYVINDMLVTDSVGSMPTGGLYNQQLVAAGNYTADGVYNLLPEDGGDGNALDELIAAVTSGAAQQNQQDWTIRVAQAGQVAKQAGKLSAGAKRLVDSLVDPKVPWQEVLRRFVSKRAKTDRSFSRPNRRLLTQNLYMPAMSGETLGKIAIAVDCSGSISNEILREFSSEIHAIKESMRPSSIDVYYFDSKVSHTESYGVDDELNIQPHGGGGTAFSPVMEAVNNGEELPEALVFLTDLYCNDFGPPPEYPVLWVTNGAEEAPWGEVIKM